jgi:exonuclease SbcC
VKLLRLRLENFRQHADTDLSFGEGMTAIIGPNGSGKSTLVEAIGFALYGEQRDKKETVRFHWGKGKRFSVVLDFEFDGRQFQVERTHTDAHLTQIAENPILRAHGLTETTRTCERLIGLSFDQFINSFCAEQKGLAFLSFRNNAARQEEVARMLGFDRLRLAEDLAAQRRRETAIEREALERMRIPREALLDRHRESKAALAEAKRRLKALSAELSARERESAAAAETRRVAERWLELDRQRVALQGEIGGLEAARSTAGRHLAEAESAAREFASLREDAEQYGKATARLRAIAPLRETMQKAANLQGLIEPLERELQLAPPSDVAGAEAEVARLGKLVQDFDLAWSVRRAAAIGALSSAETRLDLARQALARAEAAAERGTCPECGQPIADAPERVRVYGEKVDQLAAEVEEHRTEVRCQDEPPTPLRELREKLEVASRQAEEARLLSAAAEAKRQRLLQLREELGKILSSHPQESLNQLQSDIQRLEQVQAKALPSYERALVLRSAAEAAPTRKSEHEAAEAAARQAEQRKAAVESEQAKLPFATVAAATEAVAHAQSLSEETAKLRAESSHAASLRDIAERDTAAATARLEEQESLERDIARLRTQEALHEACAREMRALRQELNVAIGPDLAARASENLALLTNGRYLALELDRNFTPSVIEDGVAKPVISGGEEDVVALALRLALSELIQERQGQPMSLLILDEVFGSLDVERRQSVLDRLTALRGRFDQILVITHLEEVHQVADQTIHLRRDPATRSTVVEPSPV